MVDDFLPSSSSHIIPILIKAQVADVRVPTQEIHGLVLFLLFTPEIDIVG